MKATGIVRRIDDLGRVVIPKEIRRTMRIREGDPLEIYTSKDGEVIFKKYSLMGGVDEFAAQLCDTLSKSTGTSVAVTDRDSVIAAAGSARPRPHRQAHQPAARADHGGPRYLPRRAERAQRVRHRVARPLLRDHRRAHHLRGRRTRARGLHRHRGRVSRRRDGVQARAGHRRLSRQAHGELKKEDGLTVVP